MYARLLQIVRYTERLGYYNVESVCAVFAHFRNTNFPSLCIHTHNIYYVYIVVLYCTTSTQYIIYHTYIIYYI